MASVYGCAANFERIFVVHVTKYVGVGWSDEDGGALLPLDLVSGDASAVVRSGLVPVPRPCREKRKCRTPKSSGPCEVRRKFVLSRLEYYLAQEVHDLSILVSQLNFTWGFPVWFELNEARTVCVFLVFKPHVLPFLVNETNITPCSLQ